MEKRLDAEAAEESAEGLPKGSDGAGSAAPDYERVETSSDGFAPSKKDPSMTLNVVGIAVGSLVAIAALIALMVFLLNSGVVCFHNWQAANCVQPKTCQLCGDTEGVKNPDFHDWSDTADQGYMICKNCGTTTGNVPPEGVEKQEEKKGDEGTEPVAVEADGEYAGSYSAPTNDGEYPFAVDASEFPENGMLHPLVKRSSSYPFDVQLAESKTSDGLPSIAFLMADSSGNFDNVYNYNYKVDEIDTLEINVQDENGEIKRAFVNSQLVLSNFVHKVDDTETLIRNYAYLFKEDNGTLHLVIPDLEGGDFYVSYIL